MSITIPPKTTAVSKNSTLPVRLSEAKSQLNILHDDLDGHVETMLYAATEYCEQVTGRAFREDARWISKYCYVPRYWFDLERNPVTAVTLVQYYTGGTLTPIDAANYRTVSSTDLGTVFEWADDFSAPTADNRADAFQVEFTTGYPDGLPQQARAAILLKLEQLFGDLEEREYANSERSMDSLLQQLTWAHYR